MKTFFFFGCLLLALNPKSAASATDLYKCVGKGGSVAIQDRPCSEGQSLAWIKHVPRSPGDHPLSETHGSQHLVEPATPNRRKPPSVPRRKASQASHPIGRHEKCEAAKQRRRRIESAAGSAKTAKLMIKLDEQVYDACK